MISSIAQQAKEVDELAKLRAEMQAEMERLKAESEAEVQRLKAEIDVLKEQLSTTTQPNATQQSQ